MKSSDSAQPRKSGRPLSFDRDAALRQAMLTFWRSGYETTSVADLIDAMGISAPSLYTAFGDKKRLFLEAMRLYAGDPDVIGRSIAEAPTARDAVRAMLTTAAETYTGDLTPRGCLLASATASGSSASADVQRAVADVRRRVEASLANRVRRDIALGLLPSGTDANALSGLAMAVTQGLSVLARDGVDRGALLAIVAAAMSAWPNSVKRTNLGAS